ncbi:MAG: hypothetical protein U9Q83_04735 [Bacteroidota bacterium]|nr:hypothetical protein [Bacteroidota bacterium]
MKKIYFILLMIIGGNISAQQFHFVNEYYQKFSDSNYFQQIYIHSDKDIYSVDENIWLKTYVFDAKNSKLDTNKQLIFVELISPNKKIIYVKKYFVKKGVS